MRKLVFAAATLTIASAAGAGQQRVVMQGPGASYSPPMAGGGFHAAPPAPSMQAPRPMPMTQPMPMQHSMPMQQPMPVTNAMPMHAGHRWSGQRWGGQVSGHWVGGMRAPGGWSAYRWPYRGYSLPSYWVSPSFFLSDWSAYGLSQPPYGYNWARYYDDAVLIDGGGRVYDSVSGVDWNRYEAGEGPREWDAYEANSQAYAEQPDDQYSAPPEHRRHREPGAGYAPAQEDGYHQRRNDGVKGALIGGAVGGVAGGLIAGRHDKVAGALIGAGAGAALGYVIDKNTGRRVYAAPQSGAGYPPPGYGPGPGYPPPPGYGPPPHGGFGPPTVIQSGGGTTVTTTTTGGVPSGTYVNGNWYPPATVMTVTVASAPVVTTTTEIFEDSVTYTRAPVRRVYRHVVRRAPRCLCR